MTAELYQSALEQATGEFEGLYKGKCRFIRGTQERVDSVKMIMMRAKDIERELSGDGEGPDTFNLAGFNFETGTWEKCPVCGTPEIQQRSREGKDYLGCKKCGVLLNPGVIRLMRKPRK